MKILIWTILLIFLGVASISRDIHVNSFFTKLKEKIVIQFPPDPDPQQLQCMALNIYFESALEPREGKIAIGQVVLNRVESQSYPDTICKVVKQGVHFKNGEPVKNKCQFSWYCDGINDEPWKGRRWFESYDIAHKLLTNYPFYDFAKGSLFYHAKYVNPWWSKHFTKVTQIGKHIFYKIQ